MPPRSVEQHLFAEPYQFDFFQAVRLLQRLAPNQALIGQNGPPGKEPVRFRTQASLNFPASVIHELLPTDKVWSMPRMMITFMGLTGPSGVLPRHYTEQIFRLERETRGEERRAFRDWLDLFNHRLISLFYRSWEKYRFWIAHERGEADNSSSDLFTLALRSFIGVGTPGLRDRLRVVAVDPGSDMERPLARVEDLSLLHYGGLLAQRKRNAAGLEALLTDYFGVPAKVKQFIGQWLQLETASQTQLGRSNAELGISTVAGERVHDVQSKFRVRLGPLSYAQFLIFLPDRAPLPEHKGFFLLVHLVRLYAGPELDFDVQPILEAREVPECHLTEDMPGPRLGWNTWLVSQQPEHDAEDALFAGEEIVRVHEGR